jgi:hypothetical protein
MTMDPYSTSSEPTLYTVQLLGCDTCNVYPLRDAKEPPMELTSEQRSEIQKQENARYDECVGILP